MKIYKNPVIQNENRRESPQDFISNFLSWKQKNPDRNITPKAYAIIRNKEKQKEKSCQKPTG
jgi:hypothetical protein